MSERNVEAGGGQFTVRPFNPYIVARLAREVGSILKHAPEIVVKLERFRAEYSKHSAILISRAEVESHPQLGEFAKGISEEAWEAAGQQYPLRKPPSRQEQAAAVWYDVLEVVEERTIGRILALLVIDHDELRAAWRSDSVDTALAEVSAKLLFDAEPAEILDIVIAADAIAREQFGDAELEDRLGKVLAQYGLSWLMTSTSEPDESSNGESESEPVPETKDKATEAQPTGSPSLPTSPDSSTDSPSPTTGGPKSRSSAPGPSPVGSPSA